MNLNVAWLSPGGLGDEDWPVVVLSETSVRQESSHLRPMREPGVCWLDGRRVEIHYFGDFSVQQNPDLFGEIEVHYVKHLSAADAVRCADPSSMD